MKSTLISSWRNPGSVHARGCLFFYSTGISATSVCLDHSFASEILRKLGQQNCRISPDRSLLSSNISSFSILQTHRYQWGIAVHRTNFGIHGGHIRSHSELESVWSNHNAEKVTPDSTPLYLRQNITIPTKRLDINVAKSILWMQIIN